MADSGKAYNLLTPALRKWVAHQGWGGFRDIQADAIVKMLGNEETPNLVISAGTASGKTEAAFLPALSLLDAYFSEPAHREERFVSMLYVAPLKALINDQFRRMQDLTRDLSIPVYLWHGDAPQGPKKRMMKEHDGIIMITPESLESFLMNRGEWCGRYMTPKVVIVDEFHAFLGEGRGKQLLSLLSRIDFINASRGKPPATRIALSATLSKLDQVGKLLSPYAPFEVIDGTGAGKGESDIAVTTFLPPVKKHESAKNVKEDMIAIGTEIIEGSLNEKTLTFATSRMQVETIAATINDICREEGIKSEAFPHHGSLAKDVREELEHRLVSTDKPTMAVATVTLELGIDIGDIYKVFQVGTTNSVASLRQRVGRSGRRDGIRRVECLVTSATAKQDMESDLLTTIAEIEMMEAGWFEPPDTKRKDPSVLVSEILSVLKQYGSAYGDELYTLLVERGAFNNIERELFDCVLGDMEAAEFIERIPEGAYVMGAAGEREIDDWHFYATFMTEESFTVRQGKKTIGEITPPSTALTQLNQGGLFMLGGKYWQVIPPIDLKNRVINVKQVATRSKFLVPTSRGAGGVCGAVKRKKIKLLIGDDRDYVPDYLDELGEECLADARDYAKSHHLNGLGITVYDAGEKGSETDSEVAARCRLGYNDQALVHVEPPVDVAAEDAITKVLEFAGMEPGGLTSMPLWRLHELVYAVLDKYDEIGMCRSELLDSAMLADIRNSEKYNYIFSEEVLRDLYIDEKLDLAGAKRWFEAFERFFEGLFEGED